MGFRDFWPSILRLWGDTPGVSSQRFKIDSGDGHGAGATVTHLAIPVSRRPR